MSVYREHTFRRNDCSNVDGVDFNSEEVTVATSTFLPSKFPILIIHDYFPLLNCLLR